MATEAQSAAFAYRMQALVPRIEGPCHDGLEEIVAADFRSMPGVEEVHVLVAEGPPSDPASWMMHVRIRHEGALYFVGFGWRKYPGAIGSG